MPGSESPIVLREQLKELEFVYARKRFEFEIQWAQKTKKYGPKTLKKLIQMTNEAINALENEEIRRWNNIDNIQTQVLA